MAYFGNKKPTKFRKRRKSIDLKQSILQSFQSKSQTISSLSRLADVNPTTTLRNLKELQTLGLVKETLHLKSTRIFRLTELGEQYLKQ